MTREKLSHTHIYIEMDNSFIHFKITTIKSFKNTFTGNKIFLKVRRVYNFYISTQKKEQLNFFNS